MNIAELTEMQEQALEMGVVNDWEKGFMSDVIRRGKKPSSRQMNIINRIKFKVDNHDESKIKPWVKVLRDAMADPEYQPSQWTRRFCNDMVQRGLNGREVDSFSTRQNEILAEQVKLAEDWFANREGKLADRAQRQAEREARMAKEKAERDERIRLEQQIITEEGYGPIAALIDAARGKIQQPTITVKVDDQSITFKSPKGSDQTMVQSNHKKSAHRFGIIQPNGNFTFNGLLSPEMRAAIKKVNEDPFKAVIEFGHSSGSCSFCRRDLTDMRSVTVGYGPICAKRYALPWGNVSVERMTEFMVAKAQSVRALAGTHQGNDEGSIKTTQSIKCECCGKYALHPDDYATQSKRGYGEHYCNNGCDEPIFAVESEKCEARFVVETPAELIDAYKSMFGIDSIREVDTSSLQAFTPSEAVEEASEPAEDESTPAEDESPAQPSEEPSEQINEVVSNAVKATGAKPDDGLFWTNDGKSFKSRQGRYNYCKRTGAEYL